MYNPLLSKTYTSILENHYNITELNKCKPKRTVLHKKCNCNNSFYYYNGDEYSLKLIRKKFIMIQCKKCKSKSYERLLVKSNKQSNHMINKIY